MEGCALHNYIRTSQSAQRRTLSECVPSASLKPRRRIKTAITNREKGKLAQRDVNAIRTQCHGVIFDCRGYLPLSANSLYRKQMRLCQFCRQSHRKSCAGSFESFTVNRTTLLSLLQRAATGDRWCSARFSFLSHLNCAERLLPAPDRYSEWNVC